MGQRRDAAIRGRVGVPELLSGVNVVDEDPPALDYGTTWERDGFTCVSEEKGLTCTRGEHGFFANRDVIETH